MSEVNHDFAVTIMFHIMSLCKMYQLWYLVYHALCIHSRSTISCIGLCCLLIYSFGTANSDTVFSVPR